MFEAAFWGFVGGAALLIGAVAGIFGMSEAGAAFNGAEAGGFWLVTLAVIMIAVAAAAFLRRIDWI
jgi:Mg2+ and Co2+ transporter CorA